MIGLIAGAIATAVALAIPWLPTPASREAGRIDFVYWFATVICSSSSRSSRRCSSTRSSKFRAEPGDESDGPPIHGNTTIEIVWTAIPACS